MFCFMSPQCAKRGKVKKTSLHIQNRGAATGTIWLIIVEWCKVEEQGGSTMSEFGFCRNYAVRIIGSEASGDYDSQKAWN